MVIQHFFSRAGEFSQCQVLNGRTVETKKIKEFVQKKIISASVRREVFINL